MIKELEKVIPLNSMKWNEIVLNSDIPVLVDFWPERCGPWRMVGPAVEQLAQSMEDNIKVPKLNLDQNQEIAMKYNI